MVNILIYLGQSLQLIRYIALSMLHEFIFAFVVIYVSIKLFNYAIGRK